MLMTATIGRPPTPAPRQPAERRRRRPARAAAPANYVLLFGVFVVLNLIGLVMVLSASSVTALQHEGSSYYYFERQVLWLALGSLVFVATLRFDYRRWRRFA